MSSIKHINNTQITCLSKGKLETRSFCIILHIYTYFACCHCRRQRGSLSDKMAGRPFYIIQLLRSLLLNLAKRIGLDHLTFLK